MRRSNDRLIFSTRIPILGKTVFVLRPSPGDYAHGSRLFLFLILKSTSAFIALTSIISLYNQNEWKHNATLVYLMGYTGIGWSQGRDETLCDSGYYIEHDFTSTPLFTEIVLIDYPFTSWFSTVIFHVTFLTYMPSCHAQKYSVCMMFGIMLHRTKCSLDISAIGVSSTALFVKNVEMLGRII